MQEDPSTEKITRLWTRGLSGKALGLEFDKKTQKVYPPAKAKPLSHFYASKVSELGHGAFGVVRQATHLASKKDCVVKTVRQDAVGRSYMEIHQEDDHFSTLLELSTNPHPNLVEYLDFLVGPNYVFIVMERLCGLELFDIVCESAPIDDDFCKDIMLQVLSALKACHQRGIIHRDVKLESFARRTESTSSELVLMDFGLSCPAETRQDREIVGSLLYTAPEIFSRDYNTKADVWPAGVMLFVMLTGEFPFNHDPQSGLICAGFHEGDSLTEAFSRDVVCQLPETTVDLLKGLLVMSPKSRLTAAAALEHSWFQSPDDVPTSLTSQPPRPNKGKMKAARAMSTMCKMPCTANHKLLAESVEQEQNKTTNGKASDCKHGFSPLAAIAQFVPCICSK